jgi:ankyrin repeat protein
MATNPDFAQAVEENAVSIVRRFLREGEPACNYVLFLAIRYHANAVLRLLIKAGADLGAIEHHKAGGGTPLIRAIQSNNIQAFRILLRAGASINKLGLWEAPLHVAAEMGSLAFTKACLAAGARIDLRESIGVGGKTALMLAAHFGHVNLVRLLLKAGANPRLVDRYGRNARTIAADSNEPEVVRLLEGLKGPKKKR